jgi:excisionase family DNA binding protein
MIRPYTPATLAEHWECSETTVRDLIKSGRLRAFKLAEKLYRIRPEEVERFECQQNTDSSSTETNGASPTPMENEAAFVSRLGRMTGVSQRPAVVQSGTPDTQRPANG